MDGNVSREGITADLEAMRGAGLGGVILMEVDVGIPRGPVKFMSPEWRGMFAHAVREAGRLGLEVTLNAGPGWTGSGGPWVRPEQSMQHLVASSVEVRGPGRREGVLPRPKRRPAFFGDGALPAALEKAKNDFYRDVAVLAFPTPDPGARLTGVDDKALYVRAPYSSQPGTPPFLPSPASHPVLPAGVGVEVSRVVDLTGRVGEDGRWEWEVPEGSWTILRLGRTSTGANTRPAPAPGLGLESDKMDALALEVHFDAFVGQLLREVGRPQPRGRTGAGWTMLHIDSWEMGSQNWTPRFREEFRRRRGYDPMPYLPALSGVLMVWGERGGGVSAEVSERFLWDLRLTAQELVVENHARRLKTLGRRSGLGLSIEPYDMNPCADLTLGRVADVPMGEFWLMGFDTFHTVTEAVSVAHTAGRRIVAAESFTSTDAERWLAHPGMMKGLGDWAFCAGVNRIVFHRYQHQPEVGRRPGMTMGPYGVHWERTQTWWEMVAAYHRYLARCQYLLRQGVPVVDVCFLAAEGAPMVFRPPTSAIRGSPPERVGYAFDGCAPETLMERARVKGGRVEFPEGASYAVLVLPERETMTPRLLEKIRDLVWAGATVVGPRPLKSPGLAGYQACDDAVRRLASELWGDCDGETVREHRFGRGRVVWDRVAEGDWVRPGGEPEQYGSMRTVERVLGGMGVPLDFAADSRLRYHHRRVGDHDFYFVSSRSTNALLANCGFRVTGKVPELWDPMSGGIRSTAWFKEREGRTWVPVVLEPEGSVFVVFGPGQRNSAGRGVSVLQAGAGGFPGPGDVLESMSRLAVAWEGGTALRVVTGSSGTHRLLGERGVAWETEVPAVPGPRNVDGPWQLRFPPGAGAPTEPRELPALIDWSVDGDVGVRHYSGMATYRASLSGPKAEPGVRWWLDLGRVEVMARVRLNGRDLGVLWKAPFRVEVTGGVREGENLLEVEVANRWPNRLIGDQALPASARISSTTWNPFRAGDALLPSGLLGPVRLEVAREVLLTNPVRDR